MREMSIGSESSIPIVHLRVFLHDLNNELFAASGNLQLHNLHKGKPEADKTLLSVRQATDELSVIVMELSDYGSWCGDGVTVSVSAVDLGEVVQSGVMRASVSLSRFRKTAEWERPSSAIRVLADAQLAARAVHALMRVSLWRGAVGERVPVSVGRESGLGVVTVEDCGPAIPGDLLDRIFTVDGILECKKRGVTPGRPTALLFARLATESVDGKCWARAPGGGMRWSIGFPLAK